MTLLNAESGRDYIISDILGEGNFQRRLLDMGFTQGCRIHVVGVAPFGKTILVALRGFSVALREDAARLIKVI